MKLSLKLRDEPQHKTPLIKAKIPITVLTLPFTSGFVAGDSSDLSFNLTTNFPSCPSLRLSYAPTSQTVNGPPFSVSLKSGVGLFGSPRDSPLVISADLNLFTDRNPSFMLHIKPKFGHFSVHKTAHSNPSSKSGHGSNSGSGDESGLVGWSSIDIESGGRAEKFLNGNGKGSGGFGFGMERPVTWRDLKMDSLGEKDGILSGFKVRARSELPLPSKLLVNFRWGVNFPADVTKQLPFLTVDKIGIQRVEEVKEVKKVEQSRVGQVEKLSGMYSWLRKDLEELQRENRGLRRSLEEIKAGGPPMRTYSSNLEEERKSRTKPVAAPVSSSGFSDARSKRNSVEESVHKGMKKPFNGPITLEDELQKAIKAAAAS
uniref:Uncharacterized protein n=1 Tax=Kalanchoe fedtschenkoi TaxID=63787 RepID=A0A7N0V817_KALFE